MFLIRTDSSIDKAAASNPVQKAYLKGQVLGGLIVEDRRVEDADHDGGHALYGCVAWQCDEGTVRLSILLHRQYELAVLVLRSEQLT